jgi:PAS domain-containing protein
VLAADRLRRGRCPRRRPGPAPAERFAQSLERLSDGLVLLDEKWRFVYLNAKAERILRSGPPALARRRLLVELQETAAGDTLAGRNKPAA